MEELNITSDNGKLIGYAIDDDGFIIDTVLVGGDFVYTYTNVITVPYNSEYYRNRWNGSEWIEGATQDEIDEITKVEPQPPTELELLKERLDITEQALTGLILGGM